MYYLTAPGGRFKAGFVETGSSTLILLDGIDDKVTNKQEMLGTSDEDAHWHLSRLVVAARKCGYEPKAWAASTVTLPAPDTCFYKPFPIDLRGVYVEVKSITSEQFAAGLERVKQFVDVLRKEQFAVELKVEAGMGFALTHQDERINIRIASEVQWGSFSAKAKELFEEKGAIDCSTLLPSGVGMWRFDTQEGVLDCCARGFLTEIAAAGAQYKVYSDETWDFDPKRPFDRKAVDGLAWPSKWPELLKALSSSDADLLGNGIVMNVSAPVEVSTLSLFF